MNLRHVEFVVAAAAERSFSRAAERCHVTQPTLSNGIALIEAEFGGQLFVRTTRKVELSPFGTQLMPLIEALYRAHGELKSGVRSFYDPAQRMVRVGLSPLVDARRVTEVMDPYERSEAGCRIFFKECFLGDLEDRLQSSQLDMMIRPRQEYARPPRSLVRVSFYEEPLIYLARHDLPATDRNAGGVTLKDIAGETFVLGPDGCGLASMTRSLFQKAGLRLKEYRGQALSYQVMQEWADIGIGATIIPQSKLAPHYRDRARPLLAAGRRPAHVQFEAVWMREAAYPRHVSALHQHFRDRVPRLVQGSTGATRPAQ
ncbi:MAG: transcriptional regulator, LysR family [Panacagrimonas sp.]|jgi:DNA-binding transcriptional LysR family regulator|nr:LysR family transcriptional regulator [Panacagrimonas sp.]MCC2658212.1 transcriptional regulator, LysR family [Panacagrimonas sp.]